MIVRKQRQVTDPDSMDPMFQVQVVARPSCRIGLFQIGSEDRFQGYRHRDSVCLWIIALLGPLNVDVV